MIENLFYMIWRGIAIGVMISAPMGPVGILCIQRTLNRGRRCGYFTGLGAALSDMFYCLLTGFGISFIEDFLYDNENWIQLFGSVVLFAFALYLFRSNPSKTLKKPEQSAGSDGKNVLGGFLFTFSNPLILFLIVALFARFNFLRPEMNVWYWTLGYICIFAGAVAWWWLVTFFIDKVRSHFNIRSMRLINKVIACVILIFAIVGTYSSIVNIIDIYG